MPVGPIELILLLLFLAVAAAVIFLISRLLQGPGDTRMNGGNNGPTALEILDQRYARGETTREEYLAARDDITRSRDA